jgi:hypothetical protein
MFATISAKPFKVNKIITLSKTFFAEQGLKLGYFFG